MAQCRRVRRRRKPTRRVQRRSRRPMSTDRSRRAGSARRKLGSRSTTDRSLTLLRGLAQHHLPQAASSSTRSIHATQPRNVELARSQRRLQHSTHQRSERELLLLLSERPLQQADSHEPPNRTVGTLALRTHNIIVKILNNERPLLYSSTTSSLPRPLPPRTYAYGRQLSFINSNKR